MESSAIVYRDNMENMDFEAVTVLLSGMYWSAGIVRETVEQAARHSAVVMGAFVDGRQVGYARAVSDCTRFAYIADVAVNVDFRGRGIGTELVRRILEHPALAAVIHWTLVTRDAQKLYEKCGFTVTERPECWMEIRKSK